MDVSMAKVFLREARPDLSDYDRGTLARKIVNLVIGDGKLVRDPVKWIGQEIEASGLSARKWCVAKGLPLNTYAMLKKGATLSPAVALKCGLEAKTKYYKVSIVARKETDNV